MSDEEHPVQRPVGRYWEYYQQVFPDPPNPHDLNFMGRKGWELISIYRGNANQQGPSYYAVFKREMTIS